ncbi:hypothetical protein [Jannaschia seohaensis]|uniref:Uncharacterized protein n=1 Tax=Jannaschia seohaensis TaxID=475081 RepID=A0A2Y9B7F6_9RHOB|nr:hypothetical protein [Jannaschia seohaensis]PWJ11458.1 hypothetical protein BCF38_11925 [Jannaschia seohaensis]SSA51438.1 hypothetical protein SAMN05421539_11925 [Jannaschia seohaensis]
MSNLSRVWLAYLAADRADGTFKPLLPGSWEMKGVPSFTAAAAACNIARGRGQAVAGNSSIDTRGAGPYRPVSREVGIPSVMERKPGHS